jgi:NAD(P)-dependent dehydrogenase (short-subunit alcohol dehydrogenase family)
MAEQEFAGKVVVITGAGRGLGFGMARRFGQTGAHIVITDIDTEAGTQAAETLISEGLTAAFHPLDVRDPAQSAELVDKIVAERSQIDVWVNNAGVARLGPAEALPPEAWDECISVMLSGAFYCAQAVGRHMLARGQGVIINVSSVTAYQAEAGRVAHSAARAGLNMLTQALGIEWAKRGVRIVGIAPGVVLTDLMQRTLDEGAASMEKLQRRTPMHRLGTVAEIAEAVLYLASEQASYIVGETMRVDGGWTAYQLF